MSSVSNFERDKPRETFMAIKELYRDVANNNKPLDREHLKTKIKHIEKLFLEGS